LAASAFVATTQILTRDTLDLPLLIAVVLFAVNIPFQVMLFFMPIPFSIEGVQRMMVQWRSLSWHQWFYAATNMLSTPAILLGFVAMFWHFAWWVGILFGLATWAAFLIYRKCAFEYHNQRTAQQSTPTQPT
jgi:hypothetical protein